MNIEGYDKVIEECKALGLRKNADYSGDSIDNIGLLGTHGVATRLFDKVFRAHNLTKDNKVAQVKDESVRDTFKDIVNYATYACMLLDGTWNKKSIKEAYSDYSEDEAKALIKRINPDLFGQALDSAVKLLIG